MHRLSRRSVNSLLRYGGHRHRDAIAVASIGSSSINRLGGERDASGRRYSILRHVTCSGPASTKPLKLGNVISIGKRCESTASDFQTSDPPVEKYEYQAEVSRLMDLIVNSLYSNKEVFLRELISNASDALDKLRFLSVTEPQLLEGASELDIRIKTDQDNGVITLMDSGIGMTHQELVDSLGTIAHSGTAELLKALKDSKDAVLDSNLIDRFGLGFYSAFLVADKVVVSTKSPKSDKQHVWEGEANSSSYIVREETDPEKMIPRGTCITLHLKRDDKRFACPEIIEKVVKNCSLFLSFPIYTWQEKVYTKEVEVDEDPTEAQKDGTDDNVEKKKKTKKFVEKYWEWELTNETQPIWLRNQIKKNPIVFFLKQVEVDEDPTEAQKDGTDDNVEKKKKTKKFVEKYWEWELTNETRPIWLRNPKEVTSEEYNEFYKKRFNESSSKPLASSHFTTEGEVEFRSILYVPAVNPMSIFSPYEKNIRLYVKCVFISNDLDSLLLPMYLRFVKGVVDSNDLPLNISRESLQESRIVPIMRKRLVEKALDMIVGMSMSENREDYEFWRNFGAFLKWGCIEDHENHKRLAPLLRFFSSRSEEKKISLDEYVENMKPDQKDIYFIAADSVTSAKNTPFLERLCKKDLEVLFLFEPFDESAVTSLKSYKEKNFVDIREIEKKMMQEYGHICDWIKKRLGDKVSSVQISYHLKTSPCVLAHGIFGWFANMESPMKAQTVDDSSSLRSMLEVACKKSRRVFEINPEHPIIQTLNAACKSSAEDEEALRAIDLLYDTALLSLESPSQPEEKIYEMIFKDLSNKWTSQEPIFNMHSSQTQEAEVVAEPHPTLEAEVVEPVETGSQK